MTLEELKNVRYVEIDLRTQELIEVGFPWAGLTFSMSTSAQINWSNFPNLPSALFPLPIMDKTENLYMLAEADRTNFYLSALDYKNTQLQSGSILKGQIKACADEACVQSIVDNR